jgi:hypothetical protein
MKLNPEEPQASPYSATGKYSNGDDVPRHSVTVLENIARRLSVPIIISYSITQCRVKN